MVLEGVRHASGGFTFLDHWTWSAEVGGDVIQSSLTQVPEFNLQFPFTGIHVAGTHLPGGPGLGRDSERRRGDDVLQTR